MNQVEINPYLDHAILKPELAREDVIQAIQLGIAYKVRTVCVRPCDINLALHLCQNTETAVCCVLGFPHGVVPSSIKTEEAKLYVKWGVKEIDMVVNYSYIKTGDWEKVVADIQAVCDITKTAEVVLKVIVESNVLTLEEIKEITERAIHAGADYVKTSTGFNGPGATEEAVKMMLETARGRIKVKPSGGIRDRAKALKFIEMGCQRLGVNYTSTPAICDGNSSAPMNTTAY